LAIGYRRLSLSPAALGPVKAMVLALDIGAAAKIISPLLADKTGTVSIRDKLRAFTEKSGVPV
jgi:phosphotransferase system enzyme I (PtsP)